MKTRLPIILAILASPVLAAPFAYVPNEKSATISIIDTATDQRTANLPVGQRPRGAVTDGALLYLTDAKEGSLLTFDPANGKVLRNTRVGASPEGLGLSADGKLLAAAVEDDNSVVLVEANSGKELARIKVDGRNPEHAVFSPDGRWIYVSAEEAEQVDVIDVAKRQQVGHILVGKRPRGIAFLADGSRAYVACELAGKVYAIDVASQKVIAEVTAGQYPNGVAAHPDGRHVFVSNGRDGTVMAIETASNTVVATIAVGKRPWNMALTPDGAKLYVANGRSNSVSVIDTANYKKLVDIEVGELPWGVSIR
jgi:YVTN family beta-propeller protein